MLFGKINPTAKIPAMTDPYTFTVTEATHITATAEQYNLGAKQARFSVYYGTPTFNEDGVMTGFKLLLNNMVSFDDTEMADWGTDDIVMLNKVAAKVGTTIEETVEGFPNDFQAF